MELNKQIKSQLNFSFSLVAPFTRVMCLIDSLKMTHIKKVVQCLVIKYVYLDEFNIINLKKCDSVGHAGNMNEYLMVFFFCDNRIDDLIASFINRLTKNRECPVERMFCLFAIFFYCVIEFPEFVCPIHDNVESFLYSNLILFFSFFFFVIQVAS